MSNNFLCDMSLYLKSCRREHFNLHTRVFLASHRRNDETFEDQSLRFSALSRKLLETLLFF